MTAYLSVFSSQFRLLLQYRVAAIAGFGTQVFWGLVKAMAFVAFYRTTGEIHSMTLAQTLTYIWLGQALLALQPWQLDGEIARSIRNGDVVYELVRPVDLYLFWFFRGMARRTAPAILRAVPMFIVAGLGFELRAPESVAAGLCFLTAVIGAVLLSVAFTLLMSITAFWTVAGEGMARLGPASVMFFSGMVVPLPLFPDGLQPFLALLPMSGLVDLPFRLYMGHLRVEALGGVLLHQLAWIVLFIVLGRALMTRGLRRLEIFGG